MGTIKSSDMVIAGPRRAGKPRRSDGLSAERVVVYITEREKADIQAVARENGHCVSTLVREAVNEFVADYREKRVFERR